MKRDLLKLAMLIVVVLLSACGGGTPTTQNPAASNVDVPLVDSVQPSNGKTAVVSSMQLSVTFSEAMDPASLNDSTFKVMTNGSAPIAGTVSYSGVTAVFKPSVPLALDTVYTGTITAGARSSDGENLSSDYTWTFATSPDADGAVPTVTNTYFGVTQTNGVYGGVVVAFFSEAMDPATLGPRTFLVTGPGGVAVPGTVQYVGLAAGFYPTAQLAPNSTYTATLTTGAKDLSGMGLAAERSWTFMTPDISVLTGKSTTVANTAPADDSMSVPLNSEITVGFNQVMDPSSITAHTFTVTAPGGIAVHGVVQYTGKTASFAPATLLQPNTTYKAAITTGAKSLTGIPLVRAYEWTFTTGGESSNTPPVVQFTTPLPGDTGVAPNGSILVAFDEPMDPLSLTTSTFTLNTADGMQVEGTVTYTGITAVFSPSVQLSPGVTYTARVTKGALDANGTPMSADYVWSFTTGDGSSNTTPQVLFTNPETGDANVPVDVQIDIAFNEVVDPSTVNADNISVTGPEGEPVAGTFTYVAFALVFTPRNPLSGLSQYTVTVGTGIHDLNGNSMAQAYSFYFSTAESGGSGMPSVKQPTGPTP